MLLDVWDRWLEIALGETKSAGVAHAQLLESLSGTDNARGAALEREFRSALLAVATSAFAIDAFYAAVKERVLASSSATAALLSAITTRPSTRHPESRPDPTARR